MTQKEIDILLDKFEAGNCSPEEERLVDQLLDEQAVEMGEVYHSFISQEKLSESQENIEKVIEAETGELDNVLQSQRENMGNEYDSFVASAKNQYSTIDVDLVLKAGNGALDELLEEQEMGEIYRQFVQKEKETTSSIDVDMLIKAESGVLDKLIAEQDLGHEYTEFVQKEQEITCDIDVALLIQSYTGGLDELLNQQEQGMSKEYADFVTKEKAKSSSIRIEEILPKEEEKIEDKEEATVIPLRRRISKYSTIAAIFIAVFAAIFLLRPSEMNNTLADGLTDEERIEAELALEQTLAALGMAKNKLDKGTENMKALDNLKHTKIFK